MINNGEISSKNLFINLFIFSSFQLIKMKATLFSPKDFLIVKSKKLHTFRGMTNKVAFMNENDNDSHLDLQVVL
tara:strand:+ start:946 stop:1167 length:222 start_codon:yes stop_codon:yes gene_type:complete